MPFTVPELDRTNALFFRAMDWTGVKENGNTTPDWWFWEWFGTTALFDTNLDSQGDTLLYDYTNSLDPNIISFTLAVTNNYVNNMDAPVQLDVTAGTPSYYAVLVNDTNLADASWQPYSGSSLNVFLGATDGSYTVSVGLRGLPANATQTWQSETLILDTVAPNVIISNPTTNVVAVPYVQLQGCSPETLQGVTFDVSNALAVVTNRSGQLLSGQFFDTNSYQYTTDYFQCYDIPLTNGVNTITVHATDLAGNVTVTNFNYTLDYSTATNPTIKLIWPTNGMEICQSNFTLRGWTEDASAVVTASITDTNGDTNTVQGLVERTGVLWVYNLPLAEGTNVLTLSVTNSAGLSSETNITLVKSDMTLTLTNINGDLWLPDVSVSGLISDASYSVWINGVQGTNNGDGTWSADNVPVSAGGVASFDMNAVAPDGGDPGANDNTNKNGEIVVESAHWGSDAEAYVTGYAGPSPERTYRKGDFTITNGGFYQDYYYGMDTNFVVQYTDQEDETIATNQAIALAHYYGGYVDGWDDWDYYETNIGSLGIPQEEGALNLGASGAMIYNDKSSIVKMTLHTGGTGVIGQQVLAAINASATEEYPVSTNIPYVQINIPSLGNLGTNGWVYGTVKNGDSVDVTPSVSGVQMYSFTVGGGSYAAHIYQGSSDVTDTKVTAIVGQAIGLTCGLDGDSPPAITNFAWTVPGITFSDYVADAESAVLYTAFPKTNSGVNYYWVDKGSKLVACTVQVAGQTLTAQTTFIVLRPTGQIITEGGTVAIDNTNEDGIRLHCGSRYTPVGMLFDVNNLSFPFPPQFAGNTNIAWFQVKSSQLRREQTNSGQWYRKQGSNLCDGGVSFGTTFPYGFDISFIYPITTDTPESDALYPNYTGVSYSDSFDMYLMYQPSGGKWVPLQKVSWHWDGAGNWNGTNWMLTSHTNPGSPTGSDTTTHPTWNGNVGDLQWQPE
jgi:hypothetical protein